MSLMKRWNEYLGPKDERLEAESARYLRTGYYLLLAGVVMCVYYGVMLEQVACVADVPLLTAAGAGGVSPNVLLMGALLVACFIPLALQARRGIVSDRARFARAEPLTESAFDNPGHEPWKNPFTGEVRTESFLDLFDEARGKAGALLDAFDAAGFDEAAAHALTGDLDFSGEPTVATIVAVESADDSTPRPAPAR